MAIYLEENNKSINDILREMSLNKFISLFCSVYDYDVEKWCPIVLWPKQVELTDLLEVTTKIFWPKARQVGGSMVAGCLAAKVAISEPNSDIYVISKTEGDAQYFLKDKVKSILEHLPKVEGIDWPKSTPYKDRIEFSNGSTITSLTSSEDAGRGRSSVRLFIMDEAGAIEHARAIWKGASPAIEKHPRGQMIVISNSKSGSWFNIMLKKIDEGDVDGIDLHFMSSWTDPARDEAWKRVSITQYDNEIDFYTEYPEKVEHMFLKREGYAYPTFKSKEGGPHVNSFEPDFEHNRLIFGYDHGFEHYSVFLMMVWDMYNDHLYVFDELFSHQQGVPEIAVSMLNKIEKWERELMPVKSWLNIADSAIFSKHGTKPVSELIHAYTGLHFSKSLKYNEAASTDMLRSRFTLNKITIHPRCYNTIGQIRDLMYGKNGKIKDANNDSVDILRYICTELRQQTRPAEVKVPKAYDRRFGKYQRNMSILHKMGQDDGSEREFSAQELGNWQAF